jgi:hypothetical protein
MAICDLVAVKYRVMEQRCRHVEFLAGSRSMK